MINYPALLRLQEADARGQVGTVEVVEGMTLRGAQAELHLMHRDKALARGEFSLQESARCLLGENVYNAMVGNSGWVELLEAVSPVQSSAFINIADTFIRGAVLERYRQQPFFASAMFPVQPTRQREGTIKGLGSLPAASSDVVQEGENYPHRGFSSRRTKRPLVEKRGEMVAITREAVIFDETGQILQVAGEIGELRGLEKEERCLKVLLGVTNPYQESNNDAAALVAYDTYHTTWDNNVTSNELVDWTDIETSLLRFVTRLHPITGKPILVQGRDIVVMPAKLFTARRIINATEVREVTATNTTTLASNPVTGTISQPVTSALARTIAASLTGITNLDTIWIHGDIGRAFAYDEVWGLAVDREMADSHLMFEQDIISRWKASEYGVAYVRDPRFVNRNYSS